MNLLIFLAVLSILVIVHEWGHFAFAKAFKIPVQRFSIGFGPTIIKSRMGETEFCVSLIPFGGYVKLEGEDAKEATGDPREFASRPAWQKFAVIFAGPLLNAVLAFVLFVLVYLVGHPAYSTVVGGTLAGYPAQAAGLKAGDRILSVNGRPVAMWEDLLAELRDARGTVRLEVERPEGKTTIQMEPKIEETKTLWGKSIRAGRIGITPATEIIYIKTGFVQAVVLSFQKVVVLTGIILSSLGMIFSGQLSPKEALTGPIGIYFLTAQAAHVGWIHLVYFTASLSVSLFVLNLLPIPVLDGGHIFFILIETIIRRPLSDRFKERSIQIGMYALIGVAALVIYQDLVKYGIVDKLRSLVGLGG